MKELAEAGSLPSSFVSHEGEYLPLPSSQPLSSLPKTFANLILSILGSGVLGLPYTFKRVGWVVGILLIAASGAISYHGMMLQVYSKRRLRQSQDGIHRVIASYGDLTFHAFGSWGQFSVDVLLVLGTFAGTISYLTFISQNAASIVSGLQSTQFSSPDVSNARFTPALALIEHGAQENHVFLQFSNDKMPGLSLQNQNLAEFSSQSHSLAEVSGQEMHMLGLTAANVGLSASSHPDQYFGGVSWLSSYTYIWLVFPLEVALAAIPSVTLLAPFSVVGEALSFLALAVVMVYDVMKIAKTSSFEFMKAFGSMVAVPSAFGVGIYAFQASGIMIPIETAMEKPSKLGFVLGLAYVLCGVLYTAFAILGYGAFNENTEQVITLNLPSGIETIIIKLAICLSLFLAFPLVLNPMSELVERRFTKRKASLLLRAFVVFVICLVATTVKQFAVFLSLAGSSISCLLGFILPAAIHLKVIKEDLDHHPSFFLYAVDCLLILFGVIFGAFGTTVSFLELVGSS